LLNVGLSTPSAALGLPDLRGTRVRHQIDKNHGFQIRNIAISMIPFFKKQKHIDTR